MHYVGTRCSTSWMHVWISGAEKAEGIDVSQTIIEFPDKPDDRSSFHQGVLDTSAAMGREFRELSDGNA